MSVITRSVLPGLLGFGLIVCVNSAWAAGGSLDPTFGRGGVTATNLGQGDVIPYSIKLQPNDGKILVLVIITNTAEVLRYTSTGVLDSTFGSNGIATLPTPIGTFGSMALQSNGQIVVAGEVTDPSSGAAAFGVQRLNPNGTADTSFGSGGLAIASMGFPGTQAVLLIQPVNNDILLGAQLEPIGRGRPFQTALARFLPTGRLDSSFGSQGTVAVPAVGGCTALALLSTGEILVVNANEIAQFTSNGGLESTVTGGTIVASAGSENPSTPSIFQPNGDYLFGTEVAIGAPRNHNFAAEVLRFTPTGSTDATFANPTFRFTSQSGTAVEDVINGIAVQANGNIVVAGLHSTPSSTVNALARLTSSGGFDPAFGTNGIVTNSVPAGTGGFQGVVIQPADNKIVVVGTADNFNQLTVSRYLGQ